MSGATISFRRTQIGPVCRSIDSALEARRIDEGFQQQQRMTEARLPIASNSFLTQRQHLRRQICAAPMRQNHESAIVRNESQTIILMAKWPPNPAIWLIVCRSDGLSRTSACCSIAAQPRSLTSQRRTLSVIRTPSPSKRFGRQARKGT